MKQHITKEIGLSKNPELTISKGSPAEKLLKFLSKKNYLKAFPFYNSKLTDKQFIKKHGINLLESY